MVRRQFVAGLAGALAPLRVRGKETIAAVELWRLDGHQVCAFYVRVKTGDGLEGIYGPVEKDARMFASAIDNALWDARGRYLKTPVYRLLGGGKRTSVEACASCAGYSLEPEALRERAALVKRQGYRYQKWFCAWGPGDGPRGLGKNLEMARILRETVGDETALIFDAIGGWDLAYAREWARRVERYRPHSIASAFPPGDLESFAALRRSIGFRVVEPDPEGYGHAALHVAASRLGAVVDYLLLKPHHYFEKDAPRPVEGRIALTDRPGFGIEFDPAKVEKQTLVTWS